MKFRNKMILTAMFITLIPLIFSYGIFVNDKIATNENQIKTTLKNIAFTIVNDEYIKQSISDEVNTSGIQKYSQKIIDNIDGVDIIVICDINGKKYSHLDESQIGDIFVNPDKREVLEEGNSYYSLMEGSMGKTLRWFEPIFYNDKQVGFVMIGKYYDDIKTINLYTQKKYFYLFLMALIIVSIGAKIFADNIKREILDMEPEEIATLYRQKKIIINSVQDGIIALNRNNEIREVNKSCYKLFDNFSKDKVLNRLNNYIQEKQSFTMKELIIDNKKIFVTLKPMMKDDRYLGTLIILSDRENIKKVAKEITGVDEIVKNLRANVHEFKNSLHVILGLIQLEQYSQARDFILKIQDVEIDNSREFISINDYYVRALLLSRKIVAKEKKVKFELDSKSNLYSDHKIVNSKDLVTILGNLIENAIESSVESGNKNKEVKLFIHEDDDKIEIKVTDNGKPISFVDKDIMFIEGVSSKGKDRGTGLYLVKNRVDLYDGTIEVYEEENEKYFHVIIQKGEKYYDNSINN